MSGIWTLERYERVGVLVLDRPPLNLITFDHLLEMGEMLGGLREDPEVRAVVITGSGKSFVGGAEITEFKSGDTVAMNYGLQAGQRILRDMEEMEKPVIAAVNGFAFGGGCEIALACDMRICSESAQFGQLEINYGVIPGWAGTQRLARIIGFGRAKELVLTGRMVSSMEALQMGLVSQVFPDEVLMDGARELAGLLASKAPIAMALAKQMVNCSLEGNMMMGGALEAASSAIAMGTEDCAEGIKAFLEKRKPDFKGK